MLAEDDVGKPELIRRAFDRNKIQNDLRIVGDGEHALDYLHRRGDFSDADSIPRPDLIQLDYLIGASSGLDALNEIRGLNFRGPVIMHTGQGSEEIAVKALQCGASDYLVKGFLSNLSLQKAIQKGIAPHLYALQTNPGRQRHVASH